MGFDNKAHSLHPCNVISNYGESSKWMYFDNLKEVMESIYDIILNSMGPKGCHSIFYNNDATLGLTKDGHTILSNIKFVDETDRIIAKLLLETSLKTLNKVGDGTSTTIVFACKLISNLIEVIKTERASKNKIISGLKTYKKELIEGIQNYIKKDVSRDEIKSVVSIALDSYSDDLSDIITEAVLASKGTNIINLSENLSSEESSMSIIRGYDFDYGSVSNVFAIESNADTGINKKNKATFNNPIVIVSKSVIDVLKYEDLIKLLSSIKNTSRPVVIIATGFDSIVTNKLIDYKLKNPENLISLVECSSAKRGANYLEDLLAYTEAERIPFNSDNKSLARYLISTQAINSLEHIKNDEYYIMYDTIEKLTITNLKSSFIKKNKQETLSLKNYIEEVQQYHDSIDINEDGGAAEKLDAQYRLNKLKYGEQINLKIGGKTNSERVARIHAAEDAYRSGQSAMVNGVIRATFLSLNTYIYNIIQNIGESQFYTDPKYYVLAIVYGVTKEINCKVTGIEEGNKLELFNEFYEIETLYKDETACIDLKDSRIKSNIYASAMNDISVIESAFDLAITLLNTNSILTQSSFSTHKQVYG